MSVVDEVSWDEFGWVVMVEEEEIRRELEEKFSGDVLMILGRMECLGKDGSVRGWLEWIVVAEWNEIWLNECEALYL